MHPWRKTGGRGVHTSLWRGAPETKGRSRDSSQPLHAPTLGSSSSAIIRVGRTRYALVEHEGLLVSARRGSGDPTKAEASEADKTQQTEAAGRQSGPQERMCIRKADEDVRPLQVVELLFRSCNLLTWGQGGIAQLSRPSLPPQDFPHE